ncbi:UNVERIFIED_ORG: ACS family D-galactonate transporter-like MFS transporter [Heyndrickxia coagulans]
MKKHRWTIVFLIAVGVIVNYFDRTNMSIAMPLMQKEFDLTPGQVGIFLSAFAWSYAILQLPVGTLLDKIGVKWIARISTLIWTIACLLTAIASGWGLIIFSRILLGIGEAPYFPAAAKAVGQWVPRNERSKAIASYDAMSKLSNAIGTPLIAIIVTAWGWRGGFVATGILSLLYAIVYWIWYREPHEDKRLAKEEYEYILEGGSQSSEETSGNAIQNLRYLLSKRKVWGVFIGFAAYGYSWFLFLTWLPGYLADEMHMSILKTGWYSAIPWIIGTIAEILFGGWLVDKLIERGYNRTRVYKVFLTIGLFLGLSIIGAAFTHNAKVAVSFISIALAGLVVTSAVAYSIPTFIAPKGTVGTLTGLLTFGNNAMAIVAPIATGFIVQATGSFMYAFLLAAAILIVGILSYTFLLTDLDPIESTNFETIPSRVNSNEQTGN